MRAADVLARARDARLRARQIDETIELMRANIGPRGHSYEAKPKHTILDPMRRVVDLLDALTPLEEERASCEADIEDGRRLCRGASALVSATVGEALELAFCDGLGVPDIAARMHYPETLVENVIHTAPDALDSIGAPRLIQAGN